MVKIHARQLSVTLSVVGGGINNGPPLVVLALVSSISPRVGIDDLSDYMDKLRWHNHRPEEGRYLLETRFSVY